MSFARVVHFSAENLNIGLANDNATPAEIAYHGHAKYLYEIARRLAERWKMIRTNDAALIQWRAGPRDRRAAFRDWTGMLHRVAWPSAARRSDMILERYVHLVGAANKVRALFVSREPNDGP